MFRSCFKSLNGLVNNESTTVESFTLFGGLPRVVPPPMIWTTPSVRTPALGAPSAGQLVQPGGVWSLPSTVALPPTRTVP